MSILVTGGAGFIGSHTCLNLLESGYDVFVVDSFVNSSPESLVRVKSICEKDKKTKRDLHVFKGDLRNSSILKDIFTNANEINKKIDGVIHFAGLKSVKESVGKPILYWDANVGSTINLLNVMQSFDCNTIVFSSSATIYGRSSKTKLKENFKLKPINPYGSTKMVIEKLLNDLFVNYSGSWRVANLRYFNPIGAHESGLIGENPKGIPNNIFPFLTNVAAGNLEELRIFGKNWPTIDGTGVRDYVHVMDLAEGHVKTLEFLINNGPQCLSMNLGTGIGTSVLQLLNIFEESNSLKIPHTFVGRRSGDVARLVADNSLLKSLLNWYPKRTLNQMCKDGWRWQVNNPRGY